MTVFLTGGSGILGQALIKKLPDHRVVCLVHRSPVVASNAEVLEGDVLKPRLGLSPGTYRELAGRIDCVVHAAAETSFNESEETHFRINVEGTRQVVALASDAGVPLYHISTAFAKTARGPAPNAYSRSKAEAEAVVRDSGVPCVIVRPSRIVGDSRTGAIARFQGFHFLFDLLIRAEPLYVPAAAGAFVDFVPQDLVAGVIAALVGGGRVGGEYWATAGERALSIETTIDLCVEHVARLTGRAVERPRLISPERFEQTVKPELFAAMPVEMGPFIEAVLQMPLLLNTEPFPSSALEFEGAWNIRRPNPEEVLIRNMQFWARKRGLMTAVPLARGGGARIEGPGLRDDS